MIYIFVNCSEKKTNEISKENQESKTNEYLMRENNNEFLVKDSNAILEEVQKKNIIDQKQNEDLSELQSYLNTNNNDNNTADYSFSMTNTFSVEPTIFQMPVNLTGTNKLEDRIQPAPSCFNDIKKDPQSIRLSAQSKSLSPKSKNSSLRVHQTSSSPRVSQTFIEEVIHENYIGQLDNLINNLINNKDSLYSVLLPHIAKKIAESPKKTDSTITDTVFNCGETYSIKQKTFLDKEINRLNRIKDVFKKLLYYVSELENRKKIYKKNELEHEKKLKKVKDAEKHYMLLFQGWHAEYEKLKTENNRLKSTYHQLVDEFNNNCLSLSQKELKLKQCAEDINVMLLFTNEIEKTIISREKYIVELENLINSNIFNSNKPSLQKEYKSIRDNNKCSGLSKNSKFINELIEIKKRINPNFLITQSDPLIKTHSPLKSETLSVETPCIIKSEIEEKNISLPLQKARKNLNVNDYDTLNKVDISAWSPETNRGLLDDDTYLQCKLTTQTVNTPFTSELEAQKNPEINDNKAQKLKSIDINNLDENKEKKQVWWRRLLCKCNNKKNLNN